MGVCVCVWVWVCVWVYVGVGGWVCVWGGGEVPGCEATASSRQVHPHPRSTTHLIEAHACEGRLRELAPVQRLFHGVPAPQPPVARVVAAVRTVHDLWVPQNQAPGCDEGRNTGSPQGLNEGEWGL